MTGKPQPSETPNRHLTDEEILAFLDHEVTAADASWMQRHSEGCNECRNRMEKCREDLAWLAKAREASKLDPLIVDNPPVSLFKERLAEHARKKREEKERGSVPGTWWAELRRSPGQALWRHRTAAVATVVAVALVVATTMTVLNPNASAETILLRAENYEGRLRPAPGTVSRSIVNVEVVGSRGETPKKLGTVTVVRDSATTAVHMSAEFLDQPKEDATVGNEQSMGSLSEQAFGSTNVIERPVLDYFRKQNCFPDVSIAEFRKFVSGRGESKASASLRHGVFELHFPFAAGHVSGVREAVLRVEKATYAPLELILFVGEKNAEREYHFTRSSDSLIPRAVEWSKVFPVLSADSGSTPKEIAKPAAQPVSYSNSKATALEVTVANALHGIGACQGEEVFVFPMNDGSLLVQGLVDQVSRRDVIRQALLQLRSENLRVQIYTPNELRPDIRLYPSPDALGTSSSPAGAGSSNETGDISAGGEMPMHDVLYKEAIASGKSPEEAEKRVSKSSNDIVHQARTILLHAWAMKRLDEEFASSRVQGLEGTSLSIVNSMREDHRKAIGKLAGTMSEMLTQMERDAGIVPRASNGPGASDVLSLAQAQDELVRGLFTSSAHKSSVNADLPVLEETLHQLEEAVSEDSAPKRR